MKESTIQKRVFWLVHPKLRKACQILYIIFFAIVMLWSISGQSCLILGLTLGFKDPINYPGWSWLVVIGFWATIPIYGSFLVRLNMWWQGLTEEEIEFPLRG